MRLRVMLEVKVWGKEVAKTILARSLVEKLGTSLWDKEGETFAEIEKIEVFLEPEPLRQGD